MVEELKSIEGSSFRPVTSRDDELWQSRVAGEVIKGKHITYIRLNRGNHGVSLPEKILLGLKERIQSG